MGVSVVVLPGEPLHFVLNNDDDCDHHQNAIMTLPLVFAGRREAGYSL